jgi:hypothetical protein
MVNASLDGTPAGRENWTFAPDQRLELWRLIRMSLVNQRKGLNGSPIMVSNP